MNTIIPCKVVEVGREHGQRWVKVEVISNKGNRFDSFKLHSEDLELDDLVDLQISKGTA